MEDDLILGSEDESNEPEINWIDERTEARNDIDSAIYAYNFLDETDNQGADILKWGLKSKMKDAKKKCLLILFRAIDDLMIDE